VETSPLLILHRVHPGRLLSTTDITGIAASGVSQNLPCNSLLLLQAVALLFLRSELPDRNRGGLIGRPIEHRKRCGPQTPTPKRNQIGQARSPLSAIQQKLPKNNIEYRCCHV